MAMAEPIVISSLPQGESLLRDAYMGGAPQPQVIFRGARVHQAAAVAELLRRHQLEVSNEGPFRALRFACNVLTVLQAAVLPKLAAEPARPRWVQALRRYARRLRRCGRDVGGNFKDYADECSSTAQAHPNENLRRRRARRLRDKVSGLKSLQVDIPAI
ncbi:hypothetical protein ACP4OV_016733 [Aristida adscensionis]